MKKTPVIIQVIVISILILLADLVTASRSDGSILIALLFWAAVGQGIIAMAAAADLSGGKWIKTIRPYMQEYYSLLVLFPIAFLIFSRHISVYEWAIYPPNGWLNIDFFVIRNVVILLLPFIFAHFYVRASQKESSKIGIFAVLYIFSFVLSQSFMGFDIVMTFEYPWINTLMGGFFFVESMYAGIAFSAILAGLLKLRKPEAFKTAFQDFVIMIMGFALLWAGLFYSQYLVIWYGNIPEEVSFVAKRMAVPIIEDMGIYILLTLFLIPFLALISRKIKSSFPAVFIISLLVFSGLIVERLIYLLPVAHLNVTAVLLPLILLGVPFIFLLVNQFRSMTGKLKR